jgi:transcriptional regulator with XRE-family HTH domain
MKTLKINTAVFKNCQLTYSQIAKKTGLSVNTVKSIAQGKQRRIDFGVLEKIAHVLNVLPSSLIVEEK